jgi:hypothetical protein
MAGSRNCRHGLQSLQRPADDRTSIWAALSRSRRHRDDNDRAPASDRNADTHPNTNAHTATFANTNPNANSYTDAHSNRFAYPATVTKRHGYTYATNTDTVSYRHRYPNGVTDTYATAPTYTYSNSNT